MQKSQSFLSCPQCNKVFSCKNYLVQHQKIHDPDRQRKFKCLINTCGKTFYTKGYLKVHIQQTHFNIKKYECKLCEAKFKVKQRLNEHIVSTHCQEKAYQCDKCPKSFSYATALSSHAFTHLDEKQFSCSICPKRFKSPNHLRQHITNAHKEKKSFSCSQCYKNFSVKTSLKHHVKTIHEPGGGSRFGCYFCGNKFSTRTHLENHFTIHTEEKPFFCSVPSCGYSATRPRSIRQHNQRHHCLDDQPPPPRNWNCYFCFKQFNRLDHLIMHLRNHTNEMPYTCTLCHASFASSGHLKRHITSTHTKEKPFPCPECDKDFSTNPKRLDHIASIHRKEKRFHCDLCGYSSYYKNSIRIHRLACHS